MPNLVPLSELFTVENNLNSVNARNLHSALGSKRKFTDWIEFYLKDFEKDKDYSSHTSVNSVNGQQSVEYVFNFHTAKHIAMRVSTRKGIEVRDYFIECEKQVIDRIPSMQKEIIELKQQVNELTHYKRKPTKLHKVFKGLQENIFGFLDVVYYDNPIPEKQCSDGQIAEHELRRRMNQIGGMMKKMLQDTQAVADMQSRIMLSQEGQKYVER